jgi:carbon-monoxide dehydrogenase medium subunit
MKPSAFCYHRPGSIAEAVDVLADVGPDQSRVLAGGQSLVPSMAFRLAAPSTLVDINRIEELDHLSVQDGSLVIGACVRHAAFHRPVVDGALGPFLTWVARHIGHYPIRQRGTFCGSLAQADPASEWCLVAVGLGASVTAMCKRGTRRIAAADLIAGAMTTTLAEDELLTEACLPLPSSDTRLGFAEFSRRAGDFALGMVLASYRLEGGKIADACIAVGGAEDSPRRIAEAEVVLNGNPPDGGTFEAAGRAAARALDPMEDAQTRAAYRRDLVGTLTSRALERAAV